MGNKNSFNDLSQLKNLLPDDYKSEITEEKIKKEELIMNNSHTSNIPVSRKAKAPYNFVPLNDVAVPSDSRIPDFSFYHIAEDDKKHTGYIEISAQTLTPIFIRGLLSKEDYLRLGELEKEIKRLSGEQKKQKLNEKNELLKKFFATENNKPIIPGSTIRGLIRNMVEIVSYGNFKENQQFQNQLLYFRGLADQSNLRDEYQIAMVDKDDNYFPKISAGVIKKMGKDIYKIYPARRDNEGNSIYRVNYDKNSGRVAGTTITLNEFEFEEIYFKQAKVDLHKHFRFNKNTGKKDFQYKLKYALVDKISISLHGTTPNKGYLISTGNFQNKHMHWIINEEDRSSQLEVPSKVIESYKNDANRKEEFDLLKKLENNHDGIPCFFITDNKNNVKSFGHCGMFRLAYDFDLSDHVPPTLKTNKIDIPEAIFGNEFTHASRVFFEDLKGHNVTFLTENIPHILANPKPTTFQHYVVQSDYDNKKLNHYNADGLGKISAIRGYKQYWHRSGDDWMANDKERQSLTQLTKITPVAANAEFIGKIRFENLSAIELGALLFSLDLPEGCAHKIGMGKPLGLGSVKITSKLFISNRKERYNSLLTEWNKLNERDNSNYKKEFEKYILSQIGETANSLWEVDRIMEFEKLLRNDPRPIDSNTRYMKIEGIKNNEFKERKVLPKPSEVN
jgi:CRISPR-associated protein (TIGR03986 family)